MDSREQFLGALREWTAVFMSASMGTFLQFAKEHGVSMPQIGALFHIRSKGSCGVTDVGDDLGVTSAAASQMLERLVQNGLVQRREDPDDRRGTGGVDPVHGRDRLRTGRVDQDYREVSEGVTSWPILFLRSTRRNRRG